MRKMAEPRTAGAVFAFWRRSHTPVVILYRRLTDTAGVVFLDEGKLLIAAWHEADISRVA